MKQNSSNPRRIHVKSPPPAKGSSKGKKFKSPVIDDVFTNHSYKRHGTIKESSSGKSNATSYKRQKQRPSSSLPQQHYHHQQKQQQTLQRNGGGSYNYVGGTNRQIHTRSVNQESSVFKPLCTEPRRRVIMNSHQRTPYEGGNSQKRRYTSAQHQQQSYSYKSTSSSSASSSASIKYFEMKLPNRQHIHEKETEMIKNMGKKSSTATNSFPCWMILKKDDTTNGSVSRMSSSKKAPPRAVVNNSMQDFLHHIRENDDSARSGHDSNNHCYNSEMNLLTQYIQLSSPEVQLRNQFVIQLEEQIQQLHSVSQQQSLSMHYPNDKSKHQHPQYCHVFGSFASIPICTFQSDLDIALFNVGIEGNYKAAATTPTTASFGMTSTTDLKEATDVIVIDDDSIEQDQKEADNIKSKTAGSPKNSSSVTIVRTQQLRKAMLVAKWKEALDQSATSTTDDDNDEDGCALSDQEFKKYDENEDDVVSCYVNSDDEEGDDDSADPLTTYERHDDDQRGRKRAYSDSTIFSINSDSGPVADKSSSDNTTDSMTVSFFASKPPPLSSTAASIGPQGHVRIKVVSELATLSNKLRKKSISRSMQIQNVTFIKTARVPIIKIQLLSGFNVDIAIGGYGTDTSLYAAQQIQLYPTIFVPVVVFLKVLLAQHNLDEPYTGGLGSYKLYILIADHIYRHQQWCNDSQNGCRDSHDRLGPFEVLFTFLYRYGYGSNEIQDWGPVLQYPTTKLLQHRPLITASDNTTAADLSNVYKIQDCVILFRLCFQRLYLQISEHRAHQPRGGRLNDAVTLLAHLICPFQLQSSRERILQQTKQFNASKAATNPTSSFDTIREEAEQILSTCKNTTAKSTRPTRSSSPKSNTQRDRTMNEILAGYSGA